MNETNAAFGLEALSSQSYRPTTRASVRPDAFGFESAARRGFASPDTGGGDPPPPPSTTSGGSAGSSLTGLGVAAVAGLAIPGVGEAEVGVAIFVGSIAIIVIAGIAIYTASGGDDGGSVEGPGGARAPGGASAGTRLPDLNWGPSVVEPFVPDYGGEFSGTPQGSWIEDLHDTRFPSEAGGVGGAGGSNGNFKDRDGDGDIDGDDAALEGEEDDEDAGDDGEVPQLPGNSGNGPIDPNAGKENSFVVRLLSVTEYEATAAWFDPVAKAQTIMRFVRVF